MWTYYKKPLRLKFSQKINLVENKSVKMNKEKARKEKDLCNIRALKTTRDRVMSIKNEDRDKFQNVDIVLSHLCDLRENYFKLKNKYIPSRTLTKKEIFDKAKEDYEKILTIKEYREYIIEEASKLKLKFKELENEKSKT